MVKDDNWLGKAERKKQATAHTREMEEKYLPEILDCVGHTRTYGPYYPGYTVWDGRKKQVEYQFLPMDSVSALFLYSNSGKVAVLNFASYKHPGGMFLEGSKAQEECLCHESFLYNVLARRPEYYEWNNKDLNHGLYKDRALYSPSIRFIREGESCVCDVITCAAPNYNAARRCSISKTQNSNALYSRINMVLSVAAENQADTLILGAFGCGVFGQDAEEVGKMWRNGLNTWNVFSKVVFAVPPDNGNMERLRRGFEG